MSVNAYKFIIALYRIDKNLALGVCLCNSWAIFCRSSRHWAFCCFHAKRKVIFFLRWSVEYFLTLVTVFCLVLCLEYSKLLIWVGFCFLRSFCLPGGEACPAVCSSLGGSALVSVALPLPEAAEVTEGTCGGTRLLFLHSKAALAGHVLLLLNEDSGQTPLPWLEVHVQLALAAAKYGQALHVPREEFKLFCLFRAGRILEIFTISYSLVELWEWEKYRSTAQMWAQRNMPAGHAVLFEVRQSNVVSGLQGSTLKR